MKKIVSVFFTLAIIMFFTGFVSAQQKAKTDITSVKQTGEMVRFTMTSSRPFIFADNRYILYVGGKEFTRSEQTEQDEKGILTFLIPAGEFNALKDGESMYLSYGEANAEEQDMETYTKQSLKCWSLGKFSSSLLTR